MKYMIAIPKYSNRSYLGENGSPDVSWHPDPRLGKFDSIIKAKCSFLIAMKILLDNQEYSDEFINKQFKQFQYQKQFKIVRVDKNRENLLT